MGRGAAIADAGAYGPQLLGERPDGPRRTAPVVCPGCPRRA